MDAGGAVVSPTPSAEARRLSREMEVMMNTVVELSFDLPMANVIGADSLADRTKCFGDESWAADSRNPRNWPSRKKWAAVSVVSSIALPGYLICSKCLFYDLIGFNVYDRRRYRQLYDGTCFAGHHSSVPYCQRNRSRFDFVYISTFFCHKPTLLRSFIGNVRQSMGEQPYFFSVVFKPLSIGSPHKQHAICRVQHRLCIRAIHKVPHRIPVSLYVRIHPHGMFSESGAGGWAGGAPIAVGGGVVGDVFAAEDRAVAMAIYTLGPVIGESGSSVVARIVLTPDFMELPQSVPQLVVLWQNLLGGDTSSSSSPASLPSVPYSVFFSIVKHTLLSSVYG
jgi:hypothetical protein